MGDDRWIAYLLIGLIAYSVILVFFFESDPFIATQINSSVIIGLLIAILIKMNRKQ